MAATDVSSGTSLHERRLARIEEQMERAGIDALLLAKNETTRYVTGYQRYFCTSHLPFVHMALVVRGRGAVLLLPDHIVPYGARCHVIETLRLGMLVSDQVPAARKALERYGIDGGRVAIEMDFFPAGFTNALERELGGHQLVDATPLMERATMIKFPEEVEHLREGARLVDEATEAIFARADVGVTEKQLAAGAAAALAGGAEFINHLCIRTGENAYELSPLNTDRELRAGDPIQIDIGFISDGYVSDINRTLYLGGPSEEAADIIRSVVGVQRQVIEAIRPGARASDLYDVAARGMAGAGLAEHFTIPFAGHGIGLLLHENPYLAPGVDTKLEANMVLAVEPGVYVPDRGTCRMEDMVVVTENGNERLTRCRGDIELNGL